jgi:NAD(P)-dependent dehydrogenase (short-subunit alcohol dehydrogenase family)
VANAGTTGVNVNAQDISEQDWQTTVDINLTGTWHTVKAALPAMIEAGNGGSIILISSGVGIKALEHQADYGTTKAAVNYLTRVLALENGRHAIRVNCIAPGNVDTPMVMNEHIFHAFRPDLENPTRDDVEPVFANLNPLKVKPWLAPSDIANAVLWLASDEAAFITGVILPVDMGGTTS